MAPDGLFTLPIDNVPLLYRAAKGHFAEVFALFQLRPNPYLLFPISCYAIRDDATVLRIRRRSSKPSLDRVRTVIDDQGCIFDASITCGLRLSGHLQASFLVFVSRVTGEDYTSRRTCI